ncbi:phosphorylase [Massilia horti]|uniref:Phosphorylase n=1 Tax=Massilia horti TaxID=2562153 RepID=A0A4Y9SXZ5_9BURK|nr:phosphorylase [Massilia horti]TFW31603.1 phosphorylase [Massilia horti]TFW31604.1 phosphorylase [Massilia horti]
MDHRPLIAVCGLPFEAAIAHGPGVVTVCATGGAVAARLAALLDDAPGCCGIISFGCAGGLDPALRPGDCVLAEAVVTETGSMHAHRGWVDALQARLPRARRGVLAGATAPVADAAAKARLWRDDGMCAVDMESHHAALAAQAHGVPFAACRVVLDPAHRALPCCATAGLREDGTTALLPLLRALASLPGEVPALAMLAADLWSARRALRGVRDDAGPLFGVQDISGGS